MREILESLPEEGRIAYTTVQTLVSGGLRGGVSGGVRNGTAGGVK